MLTSDVSCQTSVSTWKLMMSSSDSARNCTFLVRQPSVPSNCRRWLIFKVTTCSGKTIRGVRINSCSWMLCRVQNIVIKLLLYGTWCRSVCALVVPPLLVQTEIPRQPLDRFPWFISYRHSLRLQRMKLNDFGDPHFCLRVKCLFFF